MKTYIVQADVGGPIKIGRGADPEQRRIDLQIGSPHELRIIGTIDGDVESELHHRFAAHLVRGEWFRVSKEVVDWWRTDVRIEKRTTHPIDAMDVRLEPLALSAEQIASLGLLPVSLRSWRRADSAGQIPRAIRFGQKKMWRLSDLRMWIQMGCPDRAAFKRETAR